MPCLDISLVATQTGTLLADCAIYANVFPPLVIQLSCGSEVFYEWSPFFLRYSRASETRTHVKITPREKGACSTFPEEKWGLLVVYIYSESWWSIIQCACLTCP